jgi:hypothetical protein
MDSKTEQPKYRDGPFDEVCREAERLTKDGFKVYQKFTCDGCGARLTMTEPGHFYEEGTCDQCNAITNIRLKGCNYMSAIGLNIDVGKGENNAE